MTSGRFRSVDLSGESKWFADADSMRSEYRAGAIEADALLFDEKLERWFIARDHEILTGIEPSATGLAAKRARAVPPPPRVIEPRTEAPKPPAAEPSNADLRSPVKRRVVIIGLGFVAIIMYFSWSAPSSPYQASTEPQTPVAVVAAPIMEGFVTNYGTAEAPRDPVYSKLTVDLRPADGAQAEVSIAPPLGGSGRAEVAYWADTLVLATRSAVGDSIVWLATAEGERFVGSYFIFGGFSVREGGRWWVSRTDGALSELRSRPGRPDQKTVEVILRLTLPFQGLPLRP